MTGREARDDERDARPTMAEDVWDEILSPADKLSVSLGRPITVRLTEEQTEIIQNDPLRRALAPLLGSATVG